LGVLGLLGHLGWVLNSEYNKSLFLQKKAGYNPAFGFSSSLSFDIEDEKGGIVAVRGLNISI